MNRNSHYKILLVPDRFAHYRYSIFKKISENYYTEIYAPKKKDSSGIEVASIPKNTKSEPLKLNWIDIKSFSLRGICFWQTKIVFASFFKNYDCCVLWGDAWRITSWLSAFAAKISGKKVIFWTHGIYGDESILKKLLRSTFYKLADHLLLYGNHSKNNLIKMGFDKNKISVINNSLDIEEQDKIYLESKNSVNKIKDIKNHHQLIFVGRLEKNKKLDMIIKNLNDINKKLGGNLNLLIIGDGSERQSLENLCRQNNATNLVNFYGACYDQKIIGPLIAQSSICVSPGNVGLTAMQALVYGVPVITHNDPCRQMPEFEAVIEGVSGALFDNDSQDSLIDSIIRCINYLDNKIITSESCRNIIRERYTPDYQIKIFKDAIQKISK